MAAAKGLLPEWLYGAKIKDCILYGLRSNMAGTEWGGLRTKTTEAKVAKWYGDESMPLQMRIFAEQVYGDDPSGQAKDMKLRAQAMTKAGQSGSP